MLFRSVSQSRYGGAGDDTLYGGYGDDTLNGGANNDDLYGDAGDDTADYSDATSGVVVDLSAGIIVGADGVATGDGTDNLYSIENAVGSKYDDRFISNFSISNKFDGGTDETGEVNGDSISYQAVSVTDVTEDKVIVNLSTGADAQGYYDA